jgi:hypothetical protein
MHNHDGQPVCTECIMTIPASAPLDEAASSDEMKECPHCAELIRSKAKKCRYCGETLTDDGAISLRASAVSSTSRQPISKNPTARPEKQNDLSPSHADAVANRMMVIVTALLGCMFTLGGIAVMAKSPSDSSTGLGIMGGGGLSFLAMCWFIHLSRKDKRQGNSGAVSFRKAGVYLVIAAIIALGVVGLIAAGGIGASSLDAPGFIVAVVVVIVVGVGGWAILSTRCPECHRFFAAALENSAILDRRYETETVRRTDEHWDREHRRLGSTTRDEQVVHAVETSLKSYRCKFRERSVNPILTLRPRPD